MIGSTTKKMRLKILFVQMWVSCELTIIRAISFVLVTRTVREVQSGEDGPFLIFSKDETDEEEYHDDPDSNG